MIPAWETHGYWRWTVRSGLKSMFQFNQKVFDRGYVQTKLSSSTPDNGNLFFMDLTLWTGALSCQNMRGPSLYCGFFKRQKTTTDKNYKNICWDATWSNKSRFYHKLVPDLVSVSQTNVHLLPSNRVFDLFTAARTWEVSDPKGVQGHGSQKCSSVHIFSFLPCYSLQHCPLCLDSYCFLIKNFPLPCCLKCTNR